MNTKYDILIRQKLDWEIKGFGKLK